MAMEIYAHQPERTPGALLLDQALRMQGVPEPILWALQGLYDGGTAQALILGEAGRPFTVARGIRQGCPASGPVWAVLYEPVVRRLLRLAARVASIVPGVFADDIGIVADEIVPVARVIGALAARMTAGTGQRLHLATTQALLLTARARAAWAAAVSEPGFVFAPASTPSHAKYPGFQLHTDGEECDLSQQMQRVEARVRWIMSLPSGTGLRLARYAMYGHSILRYWMTLLPPHAVLRQAESRWAAMVFAAPMNAMPLEIFSPDKAGPSWPSSRRST